MEYAKMILIEVLHNILIFIHFMLAGFKTQDSYFKMI